MKLVPFLMFITILLKPLTLIGIFKALVIYNGNSEKYTLCSSFIHFSLGEIHYSRFSLTLLEI